jgi:hypothetical protein
LADAASGSGGRRIIGNLDVESDHARVDAALRAARGERAPSPRDPRFATPPAVARRLSALATALRAFAAEGDRLWTPEPVDPARVAVAPGLPVPVLETGPLERLEPAVAVLAWADTGPAAVRAGHRGLALEAAQSIGRALPGARLIASTSALLEHLARDGGSAGAGERWVLKAPYSAAGRLRILGRGRDPEPAVLRRAVALLDLFGSLLFEPWMDVIEEIGCAAELSAAGAVSILGFHRVETAPSGAFRRITVPPGRPGAAWPAGADPEALERAVEAAAAALRKAGYSGPFGIDAWHYRDHAGRPRFHPLGEMNARMTFGRVARALVERLREAGAIEPRSRASLCAGRAPRAGAGARPEAAEPAVRIPLLHEGAGEPVALWIECGG